MVVTPADEAAGSTNARGTASALAAQHPGQEDIHIDHAAGDDFGAHTISLVK